MALLPDEQIAEPVTILVVDDDDAVRMLVVTLLERAHFRVLSASGGTSALELAEKTDEPIHLLLSDVDMPQMSGPQLGKTLKALRPDMRVMLMSGGNNGLLVMNYGWAYLEKPFLSEKLIRMVKDVLHQPDRSQMDGIQFDRREDGHGKA